MQDESTTPTKTCSNCREAKPADQFGRRALSSDGLTSRCKVCTRDYHRGWVSKNRETYIPRVREQDRLRYAEDPTRHIEQARANKHRQRAQEGGFTTAEWDALCARYGHRCPACGARGVKLTVDHVVPIKAGGTSWISNIQPLCWPCNSGKGTKTIDYR